MTTAGSLDHLPALLGEFGSESSLARDPRRQPEEPAVEALGLGIAADGGRAHERSRLRELPERMGRKRFTWSSWSRTRRASRSLQVYVLLQLVADGAGCSSPRRARRHEPQRPVTAIGLHVGGE